MKKVIATVLFFGTLACGNDDTPEPAGVDASFRTCYWADDLSQYEYHASGNVFNDYIDGKEIICADEWEFESLSDD